MPTQSSSPVLHVFDKDGRESQAIGISIPNTKSVGVYSAARRGDGTLALVGFAIDDDGTVGLAHVAHYLAIVDAAKNMKIVRSDPYAPRAIVMAVDGSLWTSGYEPGVENRKSTHGMLRHFDHIGRQTAAFIPQSSIDQVGGAYTDNLALTLSGRVGWYPSAGHTYLELSPDGTITRYRGVPSGPHDYVSHLVLTDAGHVVLTKHTYSFGTASQPALSTELYSFDRLRSAWNLIQLPSTSKTCSATSVLLGSEGSIIALLGKEPNKICFVDLR